MYAGTVLKDETCNDHVYPQAQLLRYSDLFSYANLVHE